MSAIVFDAVDQDILTERLKVRALITEPTIGDYVRYPDGALERIARLSEQYPELQTSPGKEGAYYLSGSGYATFGGGLTAQLIPLDSLVLTEDKLEGPFWFFHHAEVGGGRRVDGVALCRVFDTSVPLRSHRRASED